MRKTTFLVVILSFTLYCDHQTTEFSTRYLVYIKNCVGYHAIAV